MAYLIVKLLKKRRLSVLLVVMFLLLPFPAPGSDVLSDAQRKEIVYGMYAEYREEFPEVDEISPAEARGLQINDAVVFVDIREPEERRVSQLPNAVTQERLMENLAEYAEKKKVLYCTISYRSGLRARELMKKGLQVYNLQGGILAWVLEGGEIYDSAGRTKRIHVYGPKWNYAPQGYDPVMYNLWERLF